jgi:para-nitrobenzyl esterase
VSATARTRSGSLEGARARGVLVFRGVPYAQPPVGPRRFRAPEPVKPWSSTRSALHYGPSAPQGSAQNFLVRRVTGGFTVRDSEDCLYLNVWTPALDGPPRPVLVFVHGGAFLVGSGSLALYRGARLAERGDVVVVTINYRLGALGSLALRELLPGGDSVEANLGLRDIAAALRWVREHIDAFGGDPGCVTVFGNSAGAMSLGALLAAPAGKGLFRRAVLQSGAAQHVATPSQAQAVAEHFLAELGEAGRSVSALRAAPLETLLAAQARTTLALSAQLGGLPWQPSVDRDFLPEPALDAIARGAGAEVDLLVGTNRDEWKLFQLADLRARRMDEEALRRRFARVLGESEVERAAASYAQASESRAPSQPRERWSAFQSDRFFHAPAARLLDLHAARARSSYAYLFSWAPPLASRPIGACHGMELPFVFGSVLEPWLRPWLGAAPGVRKLSHRMQEAWLAFAKTGHPGHPGLPYWPKYDADKRQAMQLGRRCTPFPGYGERALGFWHSG